MPVHPDENNAAAVGVTSGGGGTAAVGVTSSGGATAAVGVTSSGGATSRGSMEDSALDPAGRVTTVRRTSSIGTKRGGANAFAAAIAAAVAAAKVAAAPEVGRKWLLSAAIVQRPAGPNPQLILADFPVEPPYPF